jgi:hypothetical protein
MGIYEVTAHVSDDGTLVLRLPDRLAGRDVRVRVDAPAAAAEADRPASSRDPAWFVGAIDDPTFERPPQGVVPPPRTLE